MRWTLCLLGALAACDSAGPAQRCQREADAAECLVAAREKLAAGDRDLALFYFNHACRLGTAAACEETRTMLRDELDRACTGGDRAACAERAAQQAGADPAVEPTTTSAPAANPRPPIYPDGFPWLDDAAVSDRYTRQPRITFPEPRSTIAERIARAARDAGWSSEPVRSGPTGTLLAFTRPDRRVALRLEDAGAGTRLVVISDAIAVR